MRHFDLILLYSSFRRHESYLPIIKALSATYRIGIYRVDIDGGNAKIESSDNLYFKECLKYEAVEIIPSNIPIQTKVLMTGRFGPRVLPLIHHAIQSTMCYEKWIILVEGPMAGVPILKEMMTAFAKPVLFIPDRSRFALLEPEALEIIQQNNLCVVETGSPFGHYSARDEFKADYIIAYPNKISFNHNRDLYRFLSNVVKLLSKIDPNERVYVKVHSVRDGGGTESFFPKNLKLFAQPWLLKMIRFLLKINGYSLLNRLPDNILVLVIYLHNAYIFKRGSNFIAEYPNWGLQHFMGGIKKGLITGQTNLVWEALKMRVPVYNCSDLTTSNAPQSYRLPIASFGIPCCEGELNFNELEFQKIKESVRNSNFIKTLAAEIEATKQPTDEVLKMESLG
ncbi:MAG: hypothetical protein EXS63_08470 [Candidatus Omnitrophica bacterium]|nr:hypothetical protein [Candidatus Omnitrophota bacterium]